MHIRDANPDDWPQIHPFFVEIVKAGQSYAYPEGLTADESAALWLAKPPGRTVVATHDHRVVGTATMGPNRPGRGAHIATASFMVAPQASGQGIGRALGEHVIDWATGAGYRGIQFNAVVETNTAAVRLWQSLGFEILATVPGAFDHPDHGYVGLHVMFLALPEATPQSSPGYRPSGSPPSNERRR